MKTIRTKTDLAWLMAQADTQQVDSMQTVLLVGPPGSAKTVVARRMAARVKPPEGYDAVEVAWLHYGAGLVPAAALEGADAPKVSAPFRAPHHTCSTAALCGQRSVTMGRVSPPCEPGECIRPGEASLAHRGTLLLDELPEFLRGAARDLGAALVRGGPTIAGTQLPARPRLLVASANPCPCGYHGTDRCTCSVAAVAAHQARLREHAAILGIAVYVQLDLDDEAKAALKDYPV